MNLEELLARHESICIEESQLIKDRGQKYDISEQDTLSSFKIAAQLKQTTEKDILLDMIAIKYARIKNGISVKDSIRDCRNYLFYLDVIEE